jgi:hypothetical protein
MIALERHINKHSAGQKNGVWNDFGHFMDHRAPMSTGMNYLREGQKLNPTM